MGSLIVERLQRILPETDAHEALLYLEDASIALSLSRSYKGITTSSSKDLVPFFDMALLGPLPEKQMSILEDTLKAEKDTSVGHTDVTTKAHRVKGVFHLLNAAALRQRPRTSSATA